MARQDEKQRTIRRAREAAIQAAMNNNWEEAVEINLRILDLEEDPQTYNRLGRAYLELGEYEKSLASYQETLRINPTNAISRRNLPRLESLIARAAAGEDDPLNRKERDQVDLRLFITEAGKTVLTTLKDVPHTTAVESLATGERVSLQVKGNQVLVEDTIGNFLGQIEPKIGQRLSQLISGGNRYISSVVQSDPRQVRILIREIYQSPNQRGRTSFPGRLVDSSMYEYLNTRYDYEAEELLDDDMHDEPEVLSQDFSDTEETNDREIGLEDIEKNINDDDENEE